MRLVHLLTKIYICLMHHCDDGIPFCLQFLVIKLDSTFDGTIKIKLFQILLIGDDVRLMV